MDYQKKEDILSNIARVSSSMSREEGKLTNICIYAKITKLSVF